MADSLSLSLSLFSLGVFLVSVVSTPAASKHSKALHGTASTVYHCTTRRGGAPFQHRCRHAHRNNGPTGLSGQEAPGMIWRIRRRGASPSSCWTILAHDLVAVSGSEDPSSIKIKMITTPPYFVLCMAFKSVHAWTRPGYPAPRDGDPRPRLDSSEHSLLKP